MDIRVILPPYYIGSDTRLFRIVLLQGNGINLLNLLAKDVCGYGRNLFDFLFTKQEQKASTVFKSKAEKEWKEYNPRRKVLVWEEHSDVDCSDCVEHQMPS